MHPDLSSAASPSLTIRTRRSDSTKVLYIIDEPRFLISLMFGICDSGLQDSCAWFASRNRGDGPLYNNLCSTRLTSLLQIPSLIRPSIGIHGRRHFSILNPCARGHVVIKPKARCTKQCRQYLPNRRKRTFAVHLMLEKAPRGTAEQLTAPVICRLLGSDMAGISVTLSFERQI